VRSAISQQQLGFFIRR